MANGCKIEETQRIYTEGTGIKPLVINPSYELYYTSPSFPIVNECGVIDFKPTMKGCVVQNNTGGFLFGNVVNFNENANNCPLDAGIITLILMVAVVVVSVKNLYYER